MVFALPGGFVDYGKPLKTATCREAFEEKGLVVYLSRLVYYLDLDRDSRQHNILTVFVGQANGKAQAG
jgi:ADP-ribose pyrophosphatase YjhB (NUDIX family)